MTHLPKNPFCEVCSKAKIQRTQKRKAANKAAPDGPPKKPPVKFGEQVTGDHFIKNASSVIEEDASFPIDTVAVVLCDRGTKWVAVYPKTTKQPNTLSKLCSTSVVPRIASQASIAITRPSSSRPRAN